MIKRKSDTADLFQYINLVTHLGLIIVFSILIAGFIGYLVDRFLGIGPVFIIILGIMGLGGGLVSAYKVIIKSLDDYDKKNVE